MVTRRLGRSIADITIGVVLAIFIGGAALLYFDVERIDPPVNTTDATDYATIAKSIDAAERAGRLDRLGFTDYCGPKSFESVAQVLMPPGFPRKAAELIEPDDMKVWRAVAHLSLPQELLTQVEDSYGAGAARQIIATVCTANRLHNIAIGRGHYRATERLKSQPGQRTDMFDETIIANWPTIRRSDKTIEDAYPFDTSNLFFATFPGAGIAAAFEHASAGNRTEGFDVRRFYNSDEIDSDRSQYREALRQAANETGLAQEPEIQALDDPLVIRMQRTIVILDTMYARMLMNSIGKTQGTKVPLVQ